MQSLPTKSDHCRKCNEDVEIGIGQCITQCKNCSTTVYFLCHIIDKKANTKNKIVCDVCNKNYVIITCPKCKGYQAIHNFMSGFPYQCSCSYRLTYLLCNSCQNMLALPADRNYQKTKIKCKQCQNQFKYKICLSCRSCIYNPANDMSNIFVCPNKQCPQSGSVKQNFVNPYGYDTDDIVKQLDNRVDEFHRATIKVNEDPSLAMEKDICKVCQNQQAIMINTSCFHLALCQPCSQLIINKQNSMCPICRTKGEYKKVFKP